MKTNAITHAEREILADLRDGDIRLGQLVGNSYKVWRGEVCKRLGKRSLMKIVQLGYVEFKTPWLTLTAKGTQLVNTKAP